MSVRCSSSCIIFQCVPIKKPVRRKVLMLHNSHFPAKTPPMLQIQSATNNKVFEDRSKGIICYKDDNGEIVCEGYDEGPRPEPTYHPRELCIVDLLQRSWFQIVEDNGFQNPSANGL